MSFDQNKRRVMSLDQRSSRIAQDAPSGEMGCDGDEQGWWQAAGGQWYPPVTGTTCGNGHPMDEAHAFCRTCRAPRNEFAIESASPLDPAAVDAVADGPEPTTTAGSASTSMAPAPRTWPLSLLRRRTG
jgi:hypothetical protein